MTSTPLRKALHHERKCRSGVFYLPGIFPDSLVGIYFDSSVTSVFWCYEMQFRKRELRFFGNKKPHFLFSLREMWIKS
jgi:hypothetical protein